jgi:DNA-binding transcriptional LysR family regulator
VALTPQGGALHATLSIELDNILSRIALLLHDQRSVLRVGVPQALFHTFFPRVPAAFKDHAPSMRLAFIERDTTLERMMLDGELDAAVSERFFDQETITQQAIGDYHLSLIYPRAWQAGAVEEPPIQTFASREMITHETGQAARVRAVDHLGSIFGLPPRIGVTASGGTSIVQLVMAGLGDVVVPRWMVPTGHPDIAQPALREVKPMRVYFASTNLLASKNTFVQQFHRKCCEVIGPAMDTCRRRTRNENALTGPQRALAGARWQQPGSVDLSHHLHVHRRDDIGVGRHRHGVLADGLQRTVGHAHL